MMRAGHSAPKPEPVSGTMGQGLWSRRGRAVEERETTRYYDGLEWRSLS
jgi:hypothetical protein